MSEEVKKETNTKTNAVGTKKQLEWRRAKVLDLCSKGLSQVSISRILKVSNPTVSRDMTFLKEQAKRDISKLVDERLPLEVSKCLAGYDTILQHSFDICINDDVDTREKIAALNLIRETYADRLSLITNVTVVDNAMKFVQSYSDKQKQHMMKSNNESDEELDDQEEEQSGQEDQQEDDNSSTDDIAIPATTEEVF